MPVLRLGHFDFVFLTKLGVQQKDLFLSGKKKEPKPKLFGPDIFQWGRGLPRERVGAKKFDMSLETREIKLFGRDIPGFCRDIQGVPEKFEKKKFVFNFRSLFWVVSKPPGGVGVFHAKGWESKSSLSYP